MPRNQGLELGLDSPAVAVANVDCSGQHQGCDLHAFLDVVPLNVKDRRRVAEPVL